MSFTDEQLWSVRDFPMHDEQWWRITSGQVRTGDEVLVDTSAYGVPGTHWCKVRRISPGTAARYPCKVQILERGEGQYAAEEIQGWRRPVWMHEAVKHGVYMETKGK